MSVRDEFLPEFGSVAQVSARTAMVDRFELEFGDFSLTGENDDICYVLNHLGAFTIPTSVDSRAKLFNAANNKSIRSRVAVQFASGGSGKGAYHPRPIVAGELSRAGRRQGGTTRVQGEAIRLSFKTSLNLTRFVQAQRFSKRSTLRKPRLARNIVLAIHPKEDWHENEQPLLPADNLLIGRARPFGYALRHKIPELLQQYIDAFEATACELLCEQMEDRLVEVHIFPYRSLQSMEVYWEFSSDDPIGLVDQLTKPLHRLSHHIPVTREAVQGFREEVRNESKCVSLHLGADIRLRVYAKTTRRVRFEVEFKRAAISKICGGRTASSNEEVAAQAGQLVERAVEEMNWVLGELRHQVPRTESQKTVVGLLTKIALVVKDAASAQMVVSSLHTYGRLAPEGNRAAIAIAHALRDAGVLRTLGGKSIYVATDEYKDAVRRLMEY